MIYKLIIVYKSKTILLLKTFSPEEIKRFDDFLISPYFNTNARAARLFDELKKHYPGFESRGVGKENLYKKLFPGKTYNEQVMKNLISELLKLEKEFLAVNGFKNNLYEKPLALLDQLILRQAEPIFLKESLSLHENLAEADIPLERTYLYKHLLEEKIFSYNIANNKQSIASENIEKSGEYLTIFFLKTILRLCSNDHINRFSFNLNIEKNFPDMLLNSIDMKKLFDYMESVKIEETLILKLAYYGLVSIINVDDDKSYKIFHDMLYGNFKNLKREEALLFFHIMESVCAQKINSGRSDFYKELFNIYLLEISNDLYSSHSNRITVLKFRNIFLCALRVGEYEWTEKFISDFKNKLQKENRRNIIELAFAQLNFERGNFRKTLEHVNKIKTDQIFFKIDVRNINLMSLYELSHYESAISLIESFKKMLTTSNLLTKQYSQKNINFINTVYLLIKFKTGNSSEDAGLLKERVNKFEVLSNKKWLLEKIEELK